MISGITKILDEGSEIIFADGTRCKGANAVGAVILKCCEAYNKGYMSTVGKYIKIGVGLGIVGAGVSIFVVKELEKRKLKK